MRKPDCQRQREQEDEEARKRKEQQAEREKLRQEEEEEALKEEAVLDGEAALEDDYGRQWVGLHWHIAPGCDSLSSWRGEGAGAGVRSAVGCAVMWLWGFCRFLYAGAGVVC